MAAASVTDAQRSDTANFLRNLAKSRLLSPHQLAFAERGFGTGRFRTRDELAQQLIQEKILTAWQAEELLANRCAFLLGRYKLLERLGAGGQATVFLAEHLALQRPVVLKVLVRTLFSGGDALGRFQREVQAAACLNHPNIVRAYDADQVNQTPFLVLEYVKGCDLEQLYQRHGRMPLTAGCECVRQAALGLQHAYENNLVHRDIKPSNLLLTEDAEGRPVTKVLDFGLARFVSECSQESELTKAGQFIGTSDYIAPEQAENVQKADIRADIFSLGCTLFVLLSGQLPYKGRSRAEKLLKRMSAPATPLCQAMSEAPRELELVVAKMLARNPADRYQTPVEVAASLAPFCHAAGIPRLNLPSAEAIDQAKIATLTEHRNWLQTRRQETVEMEDSATTAVSGELSSDELAVMQVQHNEPADEASSSHSTVSLPVKPLQSGIRPLALIPWILLGLLLGGGIGLFALWIR